MAAVATLVPPGSAERGEAVQATVGVQPPRHRCSAAPHGLERCSAVPRGGESLDDRAARFCHFAPAHVRLDERLTEHAHVDQDHVDTVLEEAVAQVGVLDGFRVECSDQDDGGFVRTHGFSRQSARMSVGRDRNRVKKRRPSSYTNLLPSAG